MSALRYKSKIDVPAVDLPNGVELTSPAAGRVAVAGIWGNDVLTDENKDDILTLGNIIQLTITPPEEEQL